MNPAVVIAYCWEVNAQHPRLAGKPYSGGGERVELGQRGPWWFELDWPHGIPVRRCIPQNNPWGLTQIWLLANGQEVRVKKWKQAA